jgi:NAD(P)H-dependent FMN reductase
VFFFVKLKKAIDFLSLDVFNATKIVLLFLGIRVIFLFLVPHFLENLFRSFAARVCSQHYLFFVQGFEEDPTEGIGLYNDAELG